MTTPNDPQSLMSAPVTTASRDYSAMYLPGAIVLAGALIAVGLFLGLSKGGSAPQAGGAQAPREVNIKDVNIKGAPFIGKENAPLTMAYWFDYQCPFCKALDVGGIPQIPIEPALPILIRDYVDTGKLKIVFKDFAFLGPDSMAAAEYKRAVWEVYPEKFYEWHEAMFVAQDEEHGGFGNEASILELIKKIPGMDAAKLKATVAQNKARYDAEIEADTAEGQKLGIQGTPGFIVGTKAIDGAVSPDKFISAIDSQLK